VAASSGPIPKAPGSAGGYLPYVIEGERPPQDRIQRWSRAIGEAGCAPLDEQEFLRLQGIVIGDERFVKLGFRKEGGCVGVHDRDTQRPIPDHISARHEDIASLIAGLIAFDQSAESDLDPVIASAVLAFGFVYIHPFEDGNGRIHRYLMHHVLARRGFNPAGLHFPVSSAILDRITEYKGVLESYSSRLLPCVQWETTQQGNVKVLNHTADFYRFFDATPHAEFLYECVRQTIVQDLPNETNFLRNFDMFRAGIETEGAFPLELFDLFVHGLTNICRSIYYGMDLVTNAVEFNLERIDHLMPDEELSSRPHQLGHPWLAPVV
jgi:hypothetical protein